MENGNILVQPPDDMLKRGNQIWSSSLVGYFLHSSLPFKVVEPIARRLWGNLGLSNVFLHNKGYYIFKFHSKSDCDNVLASGPWHFVSKTIVLQKWQEGVEFSKSDCDKFPIWVKLSHIPLSYWSDEGISYIASAIGKPLFSDEMTTKNDFLNFARVCIEVDASSTFPSTINVVVLNEEKSKKISIPVEVEYQSRPPSCPTCKVFGHSHLKCPKSNFQWVPKVPISGASLKPTAAPLTAPLTANSGPSKTTCLGNQNAWITVSRGARLSMDPLVSSSPMITTNPFSPIASPASSQIQTVSDSESPAPINPLVAKLKVIDEKEGKDQKLMQTSTHDNPQAAKKRKGKGKVGTPPP